MSAPGTARVPMRTGAVRAADRRLGFREALGQGAQTVGELRVVELILGSLLIAEYEIPGPDIPASSIVLFAIIGLALFRRPTRVVRDLEWLVPLLVIALGYLAVVSVVVEQDDWALDWKRRLLRIGMTAIIMCVLASGRMHLRSLVVGLSVGLVVNIPAWAVLGVGAQSYEGNLTGFLGDKNVAGLAYAVGVFAVLAVLHGRRTKLVFVVILLGGLWLTGSRTSLAACAAGLLWLVLAPRLHIILRWVLALLIYWGIQLVSEDFSQVGRFSDRVGSDLLRERIDRASLEAVHNAGFFGKGLGEALAIINGSGWFFHNSYWTALVEGGWPWLVVLLLITGVFVLKPFSGHRPDFTEAAIQAGAVVLLVCSLRLGEVFFTMYWMLIIALELHRRSVLIDEDEPVLSPSPR